VPLAVPASHGAGATAARLAPLPKKNARRIASRLVHPVRSGTVSLDSKPTGR
jgi:hypothetical protein